MSTRTLRLAALVAAATLSLAACGGNGTTSDTGTAPVPTSGAATTTDTATEGAGAEGTPGAGDAYHIGITQIVSHPSLDAISQGFQDALADAGLNVIYDEKNAQNDPTVSASIAGTFADGDYDLIFGIATPTAQAVVQAITDVPIVFGAVTEPVTAGLVDSWEEPGGNVTGTSDMSPVREQLELIMELVPDVETVGVVYASTEENAFVQLEWAEREAEALGLTIESASISTTSDLMQTAESLEVDAFYVFTDNTVVSAIETLISVAEDMQVPVITSDVDSVERGAVAAYAFDYYDMGYQSGELAVRILGGEDPGTIPVETSQNLLLHVNLDAAERIGLTIPQSVLDRADTVIE